MMAGEKSKVVVFCDMWLSHIQNMPFYKYFQVAALVHLLSGKHFQAPLSYRSVVFCVVY